MPSVYSVRIGPGDVGARVMVRRSLPGGSLGDVVGVLREWTPTTLTIETRDGSLVSLDPATVVAGKPVPPPPSRQVTARRLQELSTHGWPGLVHEHLGEWLLRAGNGFTNRANSCLPYGDPGMPVTAALTAVVDWYAARGLPATLQLPLPDLASLDGTLEEAGWQLADSALVLVADLAGLAAHVPTVVCTVADEPDASWAGAYHYRGTSLPDSALDVIRAGEQLGFASVRSPSGTALAIGRGSVDDDWLGVTCVEVLPEARRRGLAHAVMSELARWGRSRGATRCYLQVADTNAAARALYDGLGFTEHHRYVYRRWPR